MDLFPNAAFDRTNQVVTRETSKKMRDEVAKRLKKLTIMTDAPIAGRVFKDTASGSHVKHSGYYMIDITIPINPTNSERKVVELGRRVLKEVVPTIRDVVGDVTIKNMKVQEWERKSYPATDCRKGIFIDGMRIGILKLMYGGPYAKALIFFDKQISPETINLK